MTTTHETRQQAHERIRDRQHEEDRPRPSLEMYQITALARRAKDDPSAMLEWATVVDPQTFLLAVAAQQWDDRHPTYACVECHDGADLPEGYVCQVCGTDNPGRYDT